MSTRDLLRAARSPDPEVALPALRELREFLMVAEAEVVIEARRRGFTWREIGELLGRRTQTVWEHYHDLTNGGDG